MAEDGEVPAVSVDPAELKLQSPRDEFRAVAAARLERLEAEGELERARRVAEARDLGLTWLPDRPGGRIP